MPFSTDEKLNDLTLICPVDSPGCDISTDAGASRPSFLAEWSSAGGARVAGVVVEYSPSEYRAAMVSAPGMRVALGSGLVYQAVDTPSGVHWFSF